MLIFFFSGFSDVGLVVCELLFDGVLGVVGVVELDDGFAPQEAKVVTTANKDRILIFSY